MELNFENLLTLLQPPRGLPLWLVLLVPWWTAGHASQGVHAHRPLPAAQHLRDAVHHLGYAEGFQPLLEFSFGLYFLHLKKICYWFSPVLKFCPAERSCFNFWVTLLQSFPSFSGLWSPPPAVYLSDDIRHRPGLCSDISLPLIPMLFLCQTDVYSNVHKKSSKLGLFWNFLILHKLHW